MYRKRAGTSGICGQLYETKLLSLLYFRAIHDDDIEEFQLASNVDNVGAFDDICFKAKVKGFNKPVAVFVQVKHRDNEKQTHGDFNLETYFNSYIKIRQQIYTSNDFFSGVQTKRRGTEKKTFEIYLETYFNSYLKIRQLFNPQNKELFFRGTYDETECLFVTYTNANIDFNDVLVESKFSTKLKHLIDTGGKIQQLDKFEKNIEYLIEIAVKDQVTLLAKRIAEFIMGKLNFKMMLNDEYVLRYHVILAQKVFEVSEIQPDGYRMASFRNDFFDTNEEHLILFKDTLFKEILKRRTITPTDIKLFLTEFLAEPTDANRLSKLIGTIIIYKNGRMEFDKQYSQYFRPDMKPLDVSVLTVNEAVELAAKEMLLSKNFKVPAAFGNKDLTMRGSNAKIERRINYLTSEICNLLVDCKYSKIVTVDGSSVGFLQLNGGIASAIGNIFVLDDNTKLMKITDNWESLGTLAKRLYSKLNSEIHNLHDYKFCFKVDKFPKLSFGEYEEDFARDFLNKFLFYCNQANENEVEEITKVEIEEYQLNQPNYFQVKTDAIFSKYHDVIQRWWINPRQVSYLTRNSDLFQNAIKSVITDSLMNLMNVTFMSKIKNINYTFTENAVRSLNLQDQHSSTVIVAENSILTTVKVMQHLKYKYHVVLDLEYIANLPTNDRNALRAELKYTNEGKVLILVCDKIDSGNRMKTLEDIAKAVRSKKTIIITNQTLLQIINRNFPEADEIIYDKKLSLIDLSIESQDSIFEAATAIFPGVEMRLKKLLKGWPKTDLRSVSTPVVASAIADEKTGKGSHQIGDEECNVPGKSQDPLSGKEPDSPSMSPRLASPSSLIPRPPPDSA